MENNAVAVKLPAFWSKRPHIWFAQAEAQFQLRNITQEATRFYHVVAALDATTAERVEDLIVTPPNADPYTVLKQRLTQAFSLSDRERAAQLLDLDDLGDRKPTAYADYILGLAGQRDTGFLLRELFIRGLPEKVRAIIASSDATDLRVLATEADRHFSGSGALIACARRDIPDIPPPPLEVLAADRPRRPKPGPAPKLGAAPKPGPAPGADPPSPDGLCYYHNRFGVNAHKCRSPCTWTQAGNATAGRRQ